LFDVFNNTIHGCDIGLNLWEVRHVQLCSDEAQTFRNNTFWRNADGIFFGELALSVQMYGTKFVENSGVDFRWYNALGGCGAMNFTTRPQVKEALFVGSLRTPHSPSTARVAMAPPNNEYFYMSGLTFVNYTKGFPLSPCLFAGCVCQPGKVPLSNFLKQGFTYRTDRLRFVNSPQVRPLLFFLYISLIFSVHEFP
jgi:hypothetical protein